MTLPQVLGIRVSPDGTAAAITINKELLYIGPIEQAEAFFQDMRTLYEKYSVKTVFMPNGVENANAN